MAHLKTSSILFSIILFLLIFSPRSVYSQRCWEKSFGGVREEEGYCIRETSDGGYIIAGYTNSFCKKVNNIYPDDAYLIRTNFNGDTVWTKTYGGEGDDFAFSVLQCKDGGFIFCGKTGSFGNGFQGYVVRTQSSGEIVWEKNFGGSESEIINEIEETEDGYILVGYTSSFGSYEKVYLIKINNDGDEIWSKVIGGSYDYWRGFSIQTSEDGGYVIAGKKSQYSFDYNLLILKTNSSGDTLWTKYYDDFVAGQIIQSHDNGFIIVGTTQNTSPLKPVILKINKDGEKIWLRTYQDNSSSYARDIRQTKEGNYIVVGHTWRSINKYYVHLMQINSNGNTLWKKYFAHGNGNSVAQTSDGGYVVTGTAFDFGNSDQLYFIKANSEGIMTNVDGQAETAIPKKPELSQNYPNPFNSSTSIQYQIIKDGLVTLKIYDLLGRVAEVLVNEEKSPGIYSCNFNLNNLTSNIYFYSLTTQGFTLTKKLILLK